MKKLALILIFCLGLALRVFGLNNFPAGINADEAALGYNAFSLIATGKDEFGHSWPVNFQSFNDWKPGFYVYLVLPFVKAFGLNEWSIRLPSAILGSLTILVIYFLTEEWISSKAALVASVLLAVNPWHLHFSRGGWETNTATFFIILGVWLFFKALKKPKYFVICVLSFASSMFTYHSARLVVPLLGLGLVVLNWKKIFTKKNRLFLAVSLLTGMVVISPLVFSFIGEAGVSRFSGVGIFADQGPLWRVNELRGDHKNPQGFFPKIIHNQYLEYAVQLVDNWLSHFSVDFLFISGDEIERNRVPGTGQMYLVLIPFWFLGLYFLFKNKTKEWKFILGWLIVAPVASALTFQSPHAIRALNMIIPLTVITSYGLVESYDKLKNRTNLLLHVTLGSLFVILFLGNFSLYLYQYYIQYPRIYPAAWEYGFSELAEYVSQNQNRFEKIYITGKYDQPYILMAFYLKYPPEEFQKQAELTPRDTYGFSTVAEFDKFQFGPVDWQDLKEKKDILIIGSSEEVPDSATIAKRIYFKDGKTEAFRIVEN